MHPDLQSCLVCDDVRQERNGKFILIGLFDVLSLSQLSVPYPRMCVVTRWCGGDGEFVQRTRIMAPDQTTVVVEGKHIPFRLASPEASATNVEIFMNVIFREAGTHWVEVEADGKMAIRFPLVIVSAPRPPLVP
ncbi:MAG: hypothetical protein KBA51_05385 [Kiritimatiellae bacterium]|nr:hypothetical protein [Kiritimatiellia bacterium]